jgi:diguanylate cyclase (GGDEF)-like protein
MFDDLFGNTQNYSKSNFEIHSHLVEVVGLLGKSIVKKRDLSAGRVFAAKAFAWGVALYRKQLPQQKSLQDVLLHKYPSRCPYCRDCPCRCWRGEKPALNEDELRKHFYLVGASEDCTVNGLQLMFRRIYEASWGSTQEFPQQVLLRLMEELAEISEAIRFFHLYPHNLENELADFFAWWFAVVSTMHRINPGEPPQLAESLLWAVYPGYCTDCQLLPCFCRPGPVRELVSKPSLLAPERVDRLTLLYSQRAYLEDTANPRETLGAVPSPIACIRLDVDSFKSINDTYGHEAGDQALRHLAAVLRGKASERDRIYRVGGDEIALISPDCSKEEGHGMMRRVLDELKRRRVRWVGQNGDQAEFTLSVSVGVSECSSSEELLTALEHADELAYASKRGGGGCISLSPGPTDAS